MKQKWGWIIGIAVLAVLLAAAAFLYPRLAEKNEVMPDQNASETAGPPQAQNTVSAPEIVLSDAEGSEIDFSSIRGDKPAVINFWSSKCPPCRSEMPDFEKAYQKYGDTVQFIMINVYGALGETETSGKEYIAEEGYTFPVYYDMDQSATITYGINSFPTSYFIDASGNIVTGARGAITESMLEKGLSMILPK